MMSALQSIDFYSCLVGRTKYFPNSSRYNGCNKIEANLNRQPYFLIKQFFIILLQL